MNAAPAPSAPGPAAALPAAGAGAPLVSVCVCTFKRHGLLPLLLASLARQTLGLAQFEIVVVDNDAAGSAAGAVAEFGQMHPAVRLTYSVEPVSGLSHARNRTVRMARGQLLAFIDDDEQAEPDWLAELVGTFRKHNADLVLGPVHPIFAPGTPDWVRAVEQRPNPQRFATGQVVPAAVGGCGNALLVAAALGERHSEPFQVRFSRTGGEDGDLFNWLRQRGAHTVWCSSALAGEHIPPERQTLRFYLARSLRYSAVFWREQYQVMRGWKVVFQLLAGLGMAVAFGIAGVLLLVVSWRRAVPLLMVSMRGIGRVRG